MGRHRVAGQIEWAGLEWHWSGWAEYQGEVDLDSCKASAIGRSIFIPVDLKDLHHTLYEKICQQADEEGEGMPRSNPMRDQSPALY
ncbi:MAG: hypothetical protein M3O22_00200 [Pseudomonadota bacterium]|nr:hypothetical protein [Pseudomonadota bacterium]